MKLINGGSERKCAQRMHSIDAGCNFLHYDEYEVAEVAERYGVHRDTAYRGIRRHDPMYPDAVPQGNGSKPRLVVSREAIEACDARRIAFYKTTPSWLYLEGLDFMSPPPRRSARALMADMHELPQRQQPDSC